MKHQLEQLAVMFAHLGKANGFAQNWCRAMADEQPSATAEEEVDKSTLNRHEIVSLSLPELV